jgi:hypothetical protein
MVEANLGAIRFFSGMVWPSFGNGVVMKFQALLIIGLTLVVAGCAEKEQVAPPEGSSADTAVESAAEAMVEEGAAVDEGAELGSSDFIAHMHHHASQLGQLNAALEVGSLMAAHRPAYWLSGHDEISDVPDEWRAFITGMREAAVDVDNAPDLEAARAAAARIEENCRGCHEAAGADIPSLQVE